MTKCIINGDMDDREPQNLNSWEWIETSSPEHVRRERELARTLRNSQWWRQQLGKGVCYHCEQRFLREDLTMDHLIPLSRGGRSTKKNVVVSCKQCNSLKQNRTVAELRLQQMARAPKL